MLNAAVELAAIPDRRSLRVIGFVLSGVAAVVIGVSIFVVQAHLTGRYMIEDPRPVPLIVLPTTRALN